MLPDDFLIIGRQNGDLAIAISHSYVATEGPKVHFEILHHVKIQNIFGQSILREINFGKIDFT